MAMDMICACIHPEITQLSVTYKKLQKVASSTIMKYASVVFGYFVHKIKDGVKPRISLVCISNLQVVLCECIYNLILYG